MRCFGIIWLFLVGILLPQAPFCAPAQTAIGGPPNLTNLPPAWTNLLQGITNGYPWWGTNMWWTNHSAFTNGPPPTRRGTNFTGVIRPAQAPAASLPGDVQSILQLFQSYRTNLLNQLPTATAKQRQQILQQLEAVRQQLQTQLQAILAQAREQADDMRGRFGGHFGGQGPGSGSGGGPGSTGHGGRPRP
jgi:hypothetical protein